MEWLIELACEHTDLHSNNGRPFHADEFGSLKSIISCLGTEGDGTNMLCFCSVSRDGEMIGIASQEFIMKLIRKYYLN